MTEKKREAILIDFDGDIWTCKWQTQEKNLIIKEV